MDGLKNSGIGGLEMHCRIRPIVLMSLSEENTSKDEMFEPGLHTPPKNLRCMEETPPTPPESFRHHCGNRSGILSVSIIKVDGYTGFMITCIGLCSFPVKLEQPRNHPECSL